MSNYQQGDRVTTPLGTGTVAYQRMAAPHYCEPEAVSVVLDDARSRPGYMGTVFAAGVVQPAARCQSQLEGGAHVWTCTAAAGHIGEHRNNERTWGDKPAAQPATCGDELTWGSGASAVCGKPAGHDGAHADGPHGMGRRRWN